MQGWTATMRWGTRSQEREVQKKKKKKKKKKKHTGTLFLKSLQFEGVCVWQKNHEIYQNNE